MAARTHSPRTLFFDLDGTLTDPSEGILACFRHALDGVVQLPDWFERDGGRIIGPPLRHSLAEALGTAATEPVEHAITRFRARFADVGIFENVLYEGVDAMLAAMRSECDRMFVVTCKPGTYAERIVDHFGLRQYFDGVFGAELDGTRAGKDELIRHALGTTMAEPSTTAMIGDRRHDIEGGRAAGTQTVAVLWGFGSKEELERARPDVLVDEIERLVAPEFWLRPRQRTRGSQGT